MARAREVRPRGEHATEGLEVDGCSGTAEIADELGNLQQPAGVCLEHDPVGLAEAQRFEVLHGARSVHVEQEATRVDAVTSAGRGLLEDRH